MRADCLDVAILQHDMSKLQQLARAKLQQGLLEYRETLKLLGRSVKDIATPLRSVAHAFKAFCSSEVSVKSCWQTLPHPSEKLRGS